MPSHFEGELIWGGTGRPPRATPHSPNPTELAEVMRGRYILRLID
jgi:hypothetical protein